MSEESQHVKQLLDEIKLVQAVFDTNSKLRAETVIELIKQTRKEKKANDS